MLLLLSRVVCRPINLGVVPDKRASVRCRCLAFFPRGRVVTNAESSLPAGSEVIILARGKSSTTANANGLILCQEFMFFLIYLSIKSLPVR
jgi:hypothetical protein